MKQKLYTTVFLTAAVLLLSICPNNTSAQLYQKGDKDLNFTIGFGDIRVLYNNFNAGLPPISVSFDYGLKDDIGPGVLSVGAIFAATTYRDQFISSRYDYGQKSTSIIGALRSTYHYQLVDKLDTYAGVQAGLRIENWKVYGVAPTYYGDLGTKIRPVINVFGGVKFYATDNIYLLAELGYGITLVNFGIGMKM